MSSPTLLWGRQVPDLGTDQGVLEGQRRPVGPHEAVLLHLVQGGLGIRAGELQGRGHVAGRHRRVPRRAVAAPVARRPTGHPAGDGRGLPAFRRPGGHRAADTDPLRWPELRFAATSSRARGFPPTRATRAVAAVPAISGPRRSLTSVRGRSVNARTSSPSTPGRPAGRCAKRNATRSRCMRRAANNRAAADSASTHCRSSTTHQQGRGLGRCGEQRQRARRDQEPVFAPAHRAPAESGGQSPRLPGRNPVQVAAKGRQEFEQAGVRQRGLGFQAADRHRTKPVGACDRGL